MSSSKHSSHRNQIRLSSDITTATLPEYIPSPGWNHFGRSSRRTKTELHQEVLDDTIWDRPPDYPDSAEEADEDTDDTDNHSPQHTHLPISASLSPRPHHSPRNSKRFLPPPPVTPTQTHRRRQSSQSHLLRSSRSQLHHKPRQASERLCLRPADPPVSDSTDPFLDSLLERSVHALEMSNTLLQSSISTQTSLSTILAGGDTAGSSRETMLEARAMNLRSRIQDDCDARAGWADDLEEITRDVEGLFGPTPSTMTEGGAVSDGKEGVGIGVSIQRPSLHRREHSTASGMSCSLPAVSTLSSAALSLNHRRPSLDLHEATVTMPGLQLARQSRDNLISPPPRPITQYAPSIQLADEIVLPSTIGVRSQPCIYQAPQFASCSTTSLLPIPSLSTPLLPPKLTDKPLEPSTPAYNMLSSFVNRQTSPGSSSSSTSFTTSFMTSIRRKSSFSNRRSSSTSPCSRRRIPQHDAASQRPMTPVEESYSSSDSCMAKRTVQCLRKILDEQPPPVARTAALGLPGDGLKAPKFMPRSPAPLPEASTSNATASISRLFTKGTHSSSTHAPSPPRQSAMKHSRNNSSSTPPTPISARRLPLLVRSSSSKSASTLNIPDLVSKALNNGAAAASTSTSGRSTPNRHISFAKLPESYASTRPGGAGASKFKEKHNRKKRKGTTMGAGASSDGGLGFGSARWWLGVGGGGGGNTGLGGLSMSLARHEERMEDRITRSWGGRMGVGLFSGGLDEWAA